MAKDLISNFYLGGEEDTEIPLDDPDDAELSIEDDVEDKDKDEDEDEEDEGD